MTFIDNLEKHLSIIVSFLSEQVFFKVHFSEAFQGLKYV